MVLPRIVIIIAVLEMHAFTDFPPSDLKISKSAILDFRFIDNNQEIMKMVSTIARSSSAPKLLRPKKTLLVIIERGKGEGPGEGGGSQGELGEGPGVVDLQRCWGCSEQSYKR